ncbi:MAG: hypothetical protein ACREBD_07390 [Blastocatellia bacterium]
MAYNQFDFDGVTQKFSLSRNERTNLFSSVVEVSPSQTLRFLLEDQIPLALAIGNEKARSELIIAPVLTEARRQLKGEVGFFSGTDFTVDPEQGLNGYCDFIFSRSPEMYSLRAPVLMIVEAKQENIPGGFGQCVAEMVAARIFNERARNGISTIYGAVTTGDNWRFLKLEGDTIFVDLIQYPIAQLGKVLGILIHILHDQEAAQAVAA